ncbi:uncharacterized protein LOC131597251 [Vicia villosa]|uniref:uncharacterized protein LOC131597251 n=1 Tax=Vicia villosa TaxID=3911 RepID=UPI00273A975D|nr:uncharacterized protein LOC131597251 [Vicia villosa]
MMHTVRIFSNTTGLVVNPQKCKLFYGGLQDNAITAIRNTTCFELGQLPVKYLGVPLTSKKLSISHYLPLIEKILDRVRHWSTRLLSYAGRSQLIQSVSNAIALYWLQCFPIPKFVLHKIESICPSFLWRGKDVHSKKSPIAWKTRKADNLWVHWIHAYYLKGQSLMELMPNTTWSWMFVSIMKQRGSVPHNLWNTMTQELKFPMKRVYAHLLNAERTNWSYLLCSNPARPRATLCLWMQCHGRLPTKDRTIRFGFIQDNVCSMCRQDVETKEHVFFECSFPRSIWCTILEWIGIKHTPVIWLDELRWVIANSNKKGWRAKILKLAFAEVIYGIWSHRNNLIFGTDSTATLQTIIDCIVHRSWIDKSIRNHIAELLL